VLWSDFIGVGQANIWGYEGFLPEFPQTCQKIGVGLLFTNFLPQAS